MGGCPASMLKKLKKKKKNIDDVVFIFKGPVYLFAIGKYIKSDNPKNLRWRIIASTSCMPSCAQNIK